MDQNHEWYLLIDDECCISCSILYTLYIDVELL